MALKPMWHLVFLMGQFWDHYCTLCMLTTLPLALCCPTKVWPSLLTTFATPRRCPAWRTALKFSKMPIGSALRHLRLNTSKAKSILISRKRKPFTLVLKLGSVIIDQVKPSNTLVFTSPQTSHHQSTLSKHVSGKEATGGCFTVSSFWQIQKAYPGCINTLAFQFWVVVLVFKILITAAMLICWSKPRNLLTKL